MSTKQSIEDITFKFWELLMFVLSDYCVKYQDFVIMVATGEKNFQNKCQQFS